MNQRQAAHVPIVASDCGSAADIVEDGEQGYVVPVRDTQTLGVRLRLLAGKCAAQGEARQEWASAGGARVRDSTNGARP
jgi:glycosyltransferase involved in cell wall biosynthesis